MDATGSRGRHWLADAALGAGCALAAITLAHAARPAALLGGPLEPVALTSTPARAPDVAPVLIAFEQPVHGEVVSPFGLRQLPWEAGGRLHEGIDIQAAPGEPVHAAADGVVTERGSDAGHGRYVAVRHAEGLTTLYAHLSAIGAGVAPGVALKAGTMLGAVGSTGSSSGPHLHFEIRDARDRPLNPSLFLGHAFAQAGDLPLRQAQRYSGRVRIAQVSVIPQRQRVLMAERAAADAMSAGSVVAAERIDGLKSVRRGADGRVHAQLTL